jgi:arylsulfatase A-like enzyme
MLNRSGLRCVAIAACFAIVVTSIGSAAEQKRWNVLLLMADDWRPEIACYGVEGMHTPNIDRLAERGVRFERAYCQFPVCNPSRASMLTGLYPNATRVVFNGTRLRDLNPDVVTLPEWFQRHGYVTANAGKCFHGKIPDPQSWTEQVPEEVPREFRRAASTAIGAGLPNSPDADNDEGGAAGGPKFVVLEGNGESDKDYHIAEAGIRLLEKYGDQTFFIAVGFHRPHAVPTAPRRFYDLYDVEKMPLAADFAPRPTLPAGIPAIALPESNDTYMEGDTSPDTARAVLRAYRASASWTDWNIGRVLEALERLKLQDNTIVVFVSDHGYHNGEKGRWGKTTVFDIALRTPLIVCMPGAKGNGHACLRTVQLLDLYPTLADLCGLPKAHGLPGHNLRPLLEDPSAAWSHPAFSMAKTGGGAIGYSCRDERWHYAEWEDGKQAVLFDTEADPHETRNLAGDAEQQERIAKMKSQLKNAFGTMPARIPAAARRAPAEETKSAQ